MSCAERMDSDERLVSIDRMRYTKNRFSSNMALAAILFNVFYFVSIYRSDVGSYYYNIVVGGSIIYNLVFMLAVFLSSEGVKAYSERFCILLGVVGVLQFARIFVIPLPASKAVVSIAKQQVPAMETAQFVRCVVYLCVSGVCCIAGSVVGLLRSRTLKAYMATLGNEGRRD